MQLPSRFQIDDRVGVAAGQATVIGVSFTAGKVSYVVRVTAPDVVMVLDSCDVHPPA